MQRFGIELNNRIHLTAMSWRVDFLVEKREATKENESPQNCNFRGNMLYFIMYIYMQI